MPCNMFSEVIQQHIPSQMSKFPEVTQPGDNKMSGANCHNRLGGVEGGPWGACPLAQRCKSQILVSLVVFAMEGHYICPFRYL